MLSDGYIKFMFYKCRNNKNKASLHFDTFLISPVQVPGMPPMPPMPMPPMPPGIGMLQAMSMMPGGPPPPGIHMGMEPPGLPPPGLSQDDQLKMAQQRAAMVLQQEERAKQQVRAGSRSMDHFKAQKKTGPLNVLKARTTQEITNQNYLNDTK